jgi:transposase
MRFRQLFERLGEHLKELDRQVRELEAQNTSPGMGRTLPAGSWPRSPALGPITASALVASVGDGNHFKNGRQLAA